MKFCPDSKTTEEELKLFSLQDEVQMSPLRRQQTPHHRWDPGGGLRGPTPGPQLGEYWDSIRELSQASYPLHGPLRGHCRWTRSSSPRRSSWDPPGPFKHSLLDVLVSSTLFAGLTWPRQTLFNLGVKYLFLPDVSEQLDRINVSINGENFTQTLLKLRTLNSQTAHFFQEVEEKLWRNLEKLMVKRFSWLVKVKMF